MREHPNAMPGLARFCARVVLLVAFSVAAQAQTATNFSGLWRQDNARCQPKRNGDVALRIEHHGAEISVDTSISRNSASPRHATQKYTTDGRVTVSTGVDGDEFHTAVVWVDSSLVFSIEEHEDGRILLSRETWSMKEGGATLERIRERPSGEKQTLVYRRVAAN